MIASNPYIAGNPVRGRGRFIGRMDVLRDVSRILHNPSANAIVLFGQRRIGKTSVLLHIERELSARKEFTPFYFDLQDKATLPLTEVLYQIAQKVSLVTKTPLPAHEQFDQEGKFFRETFIPTASKTSKNRGLVLLLDEFDVLDIAQQDQSGATFFLYLRDWMKIAKGVQFVFVLGRRPEELSINALSTFKAIRSRKISLMAQEDSKAIIRQSEKTGSLMWSDEAVDRVWYWTQGHPYLTQLLCSEIWEAAVDEDTEAPPIVSVDDVDAVIDDTLERGANAFQWIWNSLSPAERVVMAAMAEAKGEYIGQDELTDILNRSKVRLILRELEVAPETLIRWDLLRPMNTGFRFAIPILRRWVASEKPLRLVKSELDSMEPLAENLYRSGEGFYNMGNLDEAERQLRNALNVNPNHFRARLMLGQVLIGQENPAAAVEELEPAYEFDPPSAKPGLIGALLALAETQDENDQLTTYNRILAIEPSQPSALKRKQGILRDRAETAERTEDLETALKLYQQIDDWDGSNRVQRKLRRREIESQLALARKHEALEDWPAVIAIYQKLQVKYPEEGDWQVRLTESRTQAKLLEMYTRAFSVLQQGDNKLAQRLFGTIIGIQPDYKEAALHLVLASKGTDGDALLQEIRTINERITESNQQLEAEQPKQPEQPRRPEPFVQPEPPKQPEQPRPDQFIQVEPPEQPEPFVHSEEPEQPEQPKQPESQTRSAKIPYRHEFQFDLIIVNNRGEEIKRSRCKARQQVEDVGGVMLEMVFIPGGKFLMGSPATEASRVNSEGPQHEVTVAPFYMGKFPITQRQWNAVMGRNPSRFKSEQQPVENVAWRDAGEFCTRLANITGHPYRLPSEAEWEYACRAGTTTPFHFGETITPGLANYDCRRKYASGIKGTFRKRTTDVEMFLPNVFGLYDMHGNVWEWCADPWHKNYEGAPPDGSVWQTGGDNLFRVLRSGSWCNDPRDCRSASRDRNEADSWFNNAIGLRVVAASSAWPAE